MVILTIGRAAQRRLRCEPGAQAPGVRRANYRAEEQRSGVRDEECRRSRGSIFSLDGNPGFAPRA